MALLDESDEAFAEALEEFPSVVTFNGLSKPCVSQSLTDTRQQDLSGYISGSAQQVTMYATDFKAFSDAGLMDRISNLTVNDGKPLVFILRESHPNSAVVHLILSSPN